MKNDCMFCGSPLNVLKECIFCEIEQEPKGGES